jgi:hypothetical protein
MFSVFPTLADPGSILIIQPHPMEHPHADYPVSLRLPLARICGCVNFLRPGYTYVPSAQYTRASTVEVASSNAAATSAGAALRRRIVDPFSQRCFRP